MNELADRTKHALASYRDTAKLPAGEREALWMRLEASIEAGERGPELEEAPDRVVRLDRWRTAGRIAIAVAAAAAVLLLIRAIDWRSLSRSDSAADAREQAPYGSNAGRHGGAAVQGLQDTDRQREDATRPTPHDPPTAPRAEGAPKVATPQPLPPRERAPANNDVTQPRVAPAPPVDNLAEEMRLMNEARASIRAGDGDAALRTLGAHARTYAGGQMAEDREALRPQALCAAGRNEDAARMAKAFLAAYESSAHRARVSATQRSADEKKCGQP